MRFWCLRLRPLERRGRVQGDDDGGPLRLGARREGELGRGVDLLPRAVHEVVRRAHRVVVQVRALVLHVQVARARVRVQRGAADQVRAQRGHGGRLQSRACFSLLGVLAVDSKRRAAPQQREADGVFHAPRRRVARVGERDVRRRDVRFETLRERLQSQTQGVLMRLRAVAPVDRLERSSVATRRLALQPPRGGGGGVLLLRLVRGRRLDVAAVERERVVHEHAARALLVRARGSNLCLRGERIAAQRRAAREEARAQSFGGGDDGGLGFRSGTVRHFSLRRLPRAPFGSLRPRPDAQRVHVPDVREVRERARRRSRGRGSGVGGRTRAVFPWGGRRGDAPSSGGVAGPGAFRFRARGAPARRLAEGIEARRHPRRGRGRPVRARDGAGACGARDARRAPSFSRSHPPRAVETRETNRGLVATNDRNSSSRLRS